MFIISLGQGQGPVAEQAINTAVKSGGWVVLQNCHLGRSYLGPLEKKLESFESSETLYNLNQDFRLILTTMSCDFFPISILQNSMKLTCEPPKGIKSNLQETYNNLTAEKLKTYKPGKQTTLTKLFFSISLFHAVLLERRKFGPIGFNEYYKFSDSDLEAAHYSLKNLLEQTPYTPWLAMNFIIGQINYGGRVTDEWDRRTTACLLRKFCNADLLEDNF